MTGDEPLELKIDGILDLHTFRPQEVKDLVPEYLRACQKKGLHQVRIIHGKGTGALRSGVQEYLKNHRSVKRIRFGEAGEGGTGVTVVEFK